MAVTIPEIITTDINTGQGPLAFMQMTDDDAFQFRTDDANDMIGDGPNDEGKDVGVSTDGPKGPQAMTAIDGFGRTDDGPEDDTDMIRPVAAEEKPRFSHYQGPEIDA
ncbi:hypothetical protein [Bauldia sp.]|uniref:hypothetical protein n=1 Tax=Bauldia sp. TaxID=2575872 RepID=UPI003BA977E4